MENNELIICKALKILWPSVLITAAKTDLSTKASLCPAAAWGGGVSVAETQTRPPKPSIQPFLFSHPWSVGCVSPICLCVWY